MIDRNAVKTIEIAMDHLREARNLLTSAGAKRSAQAARRALDSAGGAKRHAENKIARRQSEEAGRG